jgi:hypothetical protein
MRALRNGVLGVALAVGVTTLSAACDSFLDVPNTGNLEAEAIDLERDASILSRSAYQSFVAGTGNRLVYIAWFTNEARVGDTFPTRNDFGKRDVPLDSDQGGLWNTLHNVISFAENTAEDTKALGNTVDVERAYLASGFSILLMGEAFCEGTLGALDADRRNNTALIARGPMPSKALMDSAITRLQKAVDVGKALPSNTEAQSMMNASLVGIARAHLFAGRKAQASTVAAQVPASFTYNLLHLDDPSNRGRLGNGVWSFSESRISLVTGDEFRDIANCGQYMPGATRNLVGGDSNLCRKGSATADPRIAYVDMGRVAQDGQLRFYRQDKIKGWGDADRLASGLEAQYIKVEADGNAADMLAFVNARRVVGKQAPIAATTDMNVLLKELMEQKARDFWLEGKRIGDLRRLGSGVVPYIIPSGNNYYKPELGPVGTQDCWPVPGSEVRNNPNWPKS